MSDPTTLKALTGTGGALKSILKDMHDSNLFHSPISNRYRLHIIRRNDV